MFLADGTDKLQKSLPLQWRVQYTSFKKIDWPENTKAKVPKKEWNISKDRWHSLGFNKLMTLEEAKARAKQLNAQAHLKRQEERIKKITDEQSKTQKRSFFRNLKLKKRSRNSYL